MHLYISCRSTCRSKEIIEKDEEIRVLEKYIKDHDYKTILDYMGMYLEWNTPEEDEAWKDL